MSFLCEMMVPAESKFLRCQIKSWSPILSSISHGCYFTSSWHLEVWESQFELGAQGHPSLSCPCSIWESQSKGVWGIAQRSGSLAISERLTRALPLVSESYLWPLNLPMSQTRVSTAWYSAWSTHHGQGGLGLGLHRASSLTSKLPNLSETQFPHWEPWTQ